MNKVSPLYQKLIFTFGVVSLLMLAFFNCGIPTQSGSHRSSSIEDSYDLPEGITTGDECQDIMLKTYLRKNGYYHAIKSLDCRGCHHGQQNIAPKFASLDPLESWSAFYQKEVSEGNKVSANMVGTHKLTPPESRAGNGEMVSALKVEMKDSIDDYKACMKSTLPVATPYNSPEVALASVYQPVALTDADKVTSKVSGTTTGLQSDTKLYDLHSYQRLIYDRTTSTNKIITISKFSEKSFSFDLSSGAFVDTANKQKIPLIISFTIRPTISYSATKQTIGGVEYIVNYTKNVLPELRVFNMQVRLKNQLADNTKSVLIENLMFSIDRNVVEGATIYSILSENICTTTAVAAMRDASPQFMVFPQKKDLSQAKIQVNLNNLVVIDKKSMPCISAGDTTEPLPASINFRQLTDASSSNGVFARYCIECHRVGGSGNFDITNYATAKAKATQILSRMNSATDPMPRSGRLSNRNRDLIELWLQKGTPQ